MFCCIFCFFNIVVFVVLWCLSFFKLFLSLLFYIVFCLNLLFISFLSLFILFLAFLICSFSCLNGFGRFSYVFACVSFGFCCFIVFDVLYGFVVLLCFCFFKIPFFVFLLCFIFGICRCLWFLICFNVFVFLKFFRCSYL